jgi:DNA-binding IscR family transcriptional regulator
MTRLTVKQKVLLIALAHAGENVQPTSGGFIKKYHLTTASAVQRSLSALQEKDIITSSNGKYHIYDYFLYYWLNQ